jgi:PAS domain S-box-containing protein
MAAFDLIEGSPDAMLVVDKQGRIVAINDLIEEMFQWKKDELIGNPIEMLIPSRYREGHETYRNRFGDNARKRPMGTGLQLFGIRKSGEEFRVEISLAPYRSGNRPYTIAAVRDVSGRVAEVNKMEALLYQAEQLRGETSEFRSAIQEFAQLARSSLIKATVRGVLVVTVAVFLGIVLLTYVGGKRYMCEPENLTHQVGSRHDVVCTAIFPTTKSQERTIIQARQAQAEAARQAVLQQQQRAKEDAIIQRLNRFLDKQGVP